MLSCHLCLLLSCYSLVFWVLIVPFVWLLGIYKYFSLFPKCFMEKGNITNKVPKKMSDSEVMVFIVWKKITKLYYINILFFPLDIIFFYIFSSFGFFSKFRRLFRYFRFGCEGAPVIEYWALVWLVFMDTMLSTMLDSYCNSCWYNSSQWLSSLE